MAENSWHRYGMKKLRHCHPMYKTDFWATVTRPICYRTVVPSVCNVGALCPNGWTDQDKIPRVVGMEVWPRPRPHCVTWGPSFPTTLRMLHLISGHSCKKKPEVVASFRIQRILATNHTVKWLDEAVREASACARKFSLRFLRLLPTSWTNSIVEMRAFKRLNVWTFKESFKRLRN